MTIARIHILFLIIFSLYNLKSNAQELLKCGEYNHQLFEQELFRLGDHWGYGYDDLLEDISLWEESPYVSKANIGYSVEGNPIWQLKITDSDYSDEEKYVIFFHARTHPVEVQGSWVINEVIKLLLSTDFEYQELRKKCIFFIVPMLNPDGVELEYPRENANGIDLESNWFSPEIQPEVISLKNRFRNLMLFETPVDVAINMHSAYACKRYFVYHHENGTSIPFTEMEKDFISHVKEYYPDGIENWDFYISWTGGTPLKYPESWWWINFFENVLALTYEDMNCEDAGNYEITAEALIHGIVDYLDIDLNSIWHSDRNNENNLVVYPNFLESDVNSTINLQFSRALESEIEIEIFSIDGKLIFSKQLFENLDETVTLNIKQSQIGSGVNIIKVKTKDQLYTSLIMVF